MLLLWWCARTFEKKKKKGAEKKKGENFLIFTAVALSASETATKVVGKRSRKGRDSVTGRSVPLFPVVRHSNRVHNARGATTLPNWKMEQAGTAGGAHRNATLPRTPPPVLSITYLTRYSRLMPSQPSKRPRDLLFSFVFSRKTRRPFHFPLESILLLLLLSLPALQSR